MTATFLVGDVYERMRELPDHSFDLIITSPPFLALRDYLPADHPEKHKELGREATPADFLDTMLALTAEWRRLLAPHGSIAIELGDTYAGSGGAGGDYNPDGLRAGQDKFDGSAKHRRAQGRTDWERAHPIQQARDNVIPSKGPGWPLDKSLTGIPTLYTWSLAYGRNLLRRPLSAREFLERVEASVEQLPDITVPDLMVLMRDLLAVWEEPGPTIEIEPWRIRNLKPWIRSNPPVGSLGDKERPATSYITVACTGRDRWFDLDAVRSQSLQDPATYTGNGYTKGSPQGVKGNEAMAGNPGGAPPLDWWHQIDALIDDELNARAGKLEGAVKPTQVNWKRRQTLQGGDFGSWPATSGGARGVHVRRRLEAAGYLRTLDALDISPKGYRGSHYAVWPPELVRQLVAEMCPRRVCVTCGQPSRRLAARSDRRHDILELAAHIQERREAGGHRRSDLAHLFPNYKNDDSIIAQFSNWERGKNIPSVADWQVLRQHLGVSAEFDELIRSETSYVEYTDLKTPRKDRSQRVHESPRPAFNNATRVAPMGWSDCGHNTWRPGRILDPFVGSGTTLAVATGMARDSVGIDLDPRNAHLAEQRVGMFLDVDWGRYPPTTELPPDIIDVPVEDAL